MYDLEGNEIPTSAIYQRKPDKDFICVREYNEALAKLYPYTKVKYLGMNDEGTHFLFEVFKGYELTYRTVYFMGPDYPENYPFAIGTYDKIYVDMQLLCTS